MSCTVPVDGSIVLLACLPDAAPTLFSYIHVPGQCRLSYAGVTGNDQPRASALFCTPM
jgi:hypothetical protein